MKKRDYRDIAETVFGVLLVFTFIIPVIPVGGFWLYDEFRTECHTETIKYSSSTIEDPQLSSDKSYTKTEGVHGEREICKNGHDREISRRVVSSPTDEVLVKKMI